MRDRSKSWPPNISPTGSLRRWRGACQTSERTMAQDFPFRHVVPATNWGKPCSPEAGNSAWALAVFGLFVPAGGRQVGRREANFPAYSLQCRELGQTVLRLIGAENSRGCWACSRFALLFGVPCRQGNGAELRDFLLSALSGRCKGRLGGGAGGIRTLDTVLPYTHFPGERLRPLGHRSACSGRRLL